MAKPKKTTRKPIPEATQANIFLKCRRRCCLCFWLDGQDEVKKGQLAHLDGDNTNAAEDNLAFLCLEHHDEYDSIPRLSKGLREAEVRRWRDELYKEMEYRFRTVKKHSCEVSAVRLIYFGSSSEDPAGAICSVEMRLKNTGDVELRSPVVSFRLADGNAVGGTFHYSRPCWQGSIEIQGASLRDTKGDLFSPNGRLGNVAPAPILLRGHSATFFGLNIYPKVRAQGGIQSIEYRVDAEGMQPILGTLVLALAPGGLPLVSTDYLIAEGVATRIQKRS